MKHILDKDFVYTNAASTDIRRTFAKIRQELANPNNQEKPLVQQTLFKTLADFEDLLGSR